MGLNATENAIELGPVGFSSWEIPQATRCHPGSFWHTHVQWPLLASGNCRFLASLVTILEYIRTTVFVRFP